jgi:very-short-patch-repair endonuclease
MAAVLACGPGVVLSHGSAAALWGIRPVRGGFVDISVPIHVLRRPKGIVIHRRTALTPDNTTRHEGIPLTSPVCTLIDLAAQLERELLEAAINAADKLGLADPDELRSAAEQARPRPGTRVLKDVLDRRTFSLTDSELERRFLRLVRETGIPKPETGRWVNGFKVDFHWSDLGLVVETDGLRYHRTPQQQARDRVRDQELTAAGLETLRFTRARRSSSSPNA